MNECCCSEKETSIVHPTFLSSSPQRKWWMSWCFHSTIYLLGGRDWRWMGLCGEPEVFNIHPHFHQKSISFALYCQWAQSLQSFWPTTTDWIRCVLCSRLKFYPNVYRMHRNPPPMHQYIASPVHTVAVLRNEWSTSTGCSKPHSSSR